MEQRPEGDPFAGISGCVEGLPLGLLDLGVECRTARTPGVPELACPEVSPGMQSHAHPEPDVVVLIGNVLERGSDLLRLAVGAAEDRSPTGRVIRPRR